MPPRASAELDCRGRTVPDTGAAILNAYNDLTPGVGLAALSDAFGAGLRMWLIEAGARHVAAQSEEGHWRISLHRGLSPAQGTIPGLHHLVVDTKDRVWACERAARVAGFDVHTGAATTVGTVADKAAHMAMDAAAEWLFVADAGANAMLAVAADDLKVGHRWPSPGIPQLPMVTEEGIVCVTGAGTGTLTIAWPTANGFRAKTLEVGSCPHDPVASADGRTLFVPCAGDGMIVRVDLSDGSILGRSAAGEGPSHLALHPDGTTIYSANTFDGTLSAMSVEGDLLNKVSSGAWAHVPEVTPDGGFVYVANFLEDTLTVFDARSLERVKVLPTEVYPHGLDISPDGRFVVATGFGSEFLRVYDARTHAETARIEVGYGSSHSAFLADGKTAFVTCSVDDHLARIDLDSGSCTGRFGLNG